jgi:hypothetical protein
MIGFEERMTAIGVILATDQENTSAATMTVSYWNGSAWASVTGLSDGTLQSTTDTFGQSGVIHWLAPSEISEFKTSVVNKEQYYYYKIAVSGALSDTKVDYIYGIPAQKTIRPHLYCTNWQNRVVLVNEYSNRKNSILISTKDSVCAFNGVDSTMLTFGNDDPVLCAEPIFSRFGGSTYDNLIVFKQSETWLVDGTSPEDYTLYKIADNYGCVARGTLKSCSTGYEVSPGLLKHVLIWQSASAICLFDGNSIVDISADIKNYFDPNKTEGIGSATVGNSKAFYDEHNDEYHWLFESGGESTPMNTELVYNVVKKKWYKLDRGTGKYLQIGFGARDTYGNFYTYGGIDTGYIEKLESGTTFDGTNITSTFKTADIAFGGWSNQSRIRRVKHLCIAKVTTTNTVTMTHFNDTETTATDTVTFSVNATGKRVAKVNKSVNWNEDAVFHSFNCVLITSDENVGYEPIGLNVGVRILREDIL